MGDPRETGRRPEQPEFKGPAWRRAALFTSEQLSLQLTVDVKTAYRAKRALPNPTYNPDIYQREIATTAGALLIHRAEGKTPAHDMDITVYKGQHPVLAPEGVDEMHMVLTSHYDTTRKTAAWVSMPLLLETTGSSDEDEVQLLFPYTELPFSPRSYIKRAFSKLDSFTDRSREVKKTGESEEHLATLESERIALIINKVLMVPKDTNQSPNAEGSLRVYRVTSDDDPNNTMLRYTVMFPPENDEQRHLLLQTYGPTPETCRDPQVGTELRAALEGHEMQDMCIAPKDMKNRRRAYLI